MIPFFRFRPNSLDEKFSAFSLLSKKNIFSFIIALSFLFFAFATMAVPAKLFVCLVPIFWGIMFWSVQKSWKIRKDAPLLGWSQIYVLMLDISVGFYLFFKFPSLYPNIVEWGSHYTESFPAISLIVALGSIPAAHYIFQWLLRLVEYPIQEFFRNFTKYETIFAISLFLILISALLVCSTQSSVWIAPMNPAFFLLDDPLNPNSICSGTIWGSDCRIYTVPQDEYRLNMFRHPYYSVVFFPFIPFFFLIAGLLWGLGFGVWFYCVAASMAILQIAWWILGGIMLRRMLQDVFNDTCSYAFMLFYLTSFPMIFSFVPERLGLTTFTLLAFLYFRRFSGNIDLSRLSRLDYLTAFAAGGTTLTSLLFPVFVLWRNRKSFRGYIQECFKLIGAWILLAVIWGTFFTPLSVTAQYERFSENFRWIPTTRSWWKPTDETMLKLQTTLKPKTMLKLQTTQDPQQYHQFRQFLHFIESNLFQPDYEIVSNSVYSVHQEEIGKIYIGGGMIIGILCFISCSLYRNFPLIQEMGIWFLFSVGLLGVLGFGSVTNEMTLYTSYFSWAILPLAVLPIYRLLGDKYHQTTAILLVLTVISFASQLQLIWRVTTETDFSAPQTSVEEIQEQVSDLNFLNFS
ncbi:MAG: hypothetical protein Q4C70_08185 [Planctomycetia bacterium]|nr:hypothetical protein [Planctomycetia bacterium]